jgi:predicted ABC-type ATPase
MEPLLSPTLVVIAGPQASGKSTLAGALGEELRRTGERVALVELDQIAAMALPTLPNWATAHRIFESVTHQWLRTEVTCVIAEGPGSHNEVLRIVDQAPATTATVTVALTAPVQIAFERAQRDLTRDVSRERDFLESVYKRWPEELGLFHSHLLLDTNEIEMRGSVELIRSAIATAREEQRPG